MILRVRVVVLSAANDGDDAAALTAGPLGTSSRANFKLIIKMN